MALCETIHRKQEHMRGTAQHHIPRRCTAPWKICWREVVYGILFLCSVQVFLYDQVVSSVCSSATEPSLPAAGVEAPSVGSHVASIHVWARQLLCQRHHSSGAAVAHPASAPAQHGMLRQYLHTTAGMLLLGAKHILASLAHPWLLLALLHDPHYITHLAVASLVTCGVIWPTLQRRPVSGSRRTATYMAVRLLFWTTSLVSVHTPGGLFRQHFTSSAIKGVQWKLSVGVAWCHGLLLPLPLVLQLPLCLLDWGGVAYTCSVMDQVLGAPPRPWGQHCLEGLLLVVLPVACAALAQHMQQQARSCGSSPRASTSSASSSKSGAAACSHEHALQDPQQQQQKESYPAALHAEAGAGCSKQQLPSPSPAPPAAAEQAAQVQHGSTGDGGSSGAGAGGELCISPDMACAEASGPPAAHRHRAGTAGQAAGPLGPAAAPDQQQQLLPYRVDSCQDEGQGELPPAWWYTPVTQLLTVQCKVTHPSDMEYAAAASRVKAAAEEALSVAVQQQQLVLTQLVTVPGCVLLFMEMVQPAAATTTAAAGGTAAHSTCGDNHAGRPAFLGGAWQVAVAPPPTPGQLRWQASGMAVAVGAKREGTHLQCMLRQLQQHVLSLFGGQAQVGAAVGPANAPGSNLLQGHSSPPAAGPAAGHIVHRPCTSCMIGTWGEPLQLQLVAGEGPCAGSAALPPAVRVVVTHLQQVVLDEEVTLEAPGASGGPGSSSSSGVDRGGGATTTTSLELTCERLVSSAAAPPAADSHPCTVSVCILPVTPAQVPGSLRPPQAPLPLAHITVLLLPPEPAAELAGWVAAAQLPAPHVTSWGHDLAVLVGCDQRLRAARAPPSSATLTAAGGGGPHSSQADLLQLCRLAVAAAGNLSCFFSAAGVGCTADLVAVLRQRVLVGATSLAPMAAGRVVPAVGGGGAAAGGVDAEPAVGGGGAAAGGVDAEPVAAASSIQVTVAAAESLPPAESAGAFVKAGGVVQALELTHAPPPSSRPNTAWRSRGSSNGDVASTQAGQPDAGQQAGSEALGKTPTHPARCLSGSSSSNSSKSRPFSDSHRTPGPLVTPGEAAAVAGAGWGAWLLCWRGFKAPGAEGAFQSYRGAALRRWDWVCLVYVLVLGLAMAARKVQTLEVHWTSWSAAPVWLIQLELTANVLMAALAPGWWAAHRDGILASYHICLVALWLCEALAWPAAAFQSVYGTSARRLLLVPISSLLVHKTPWAAVAYCALACPLAFTTVLLQARSSGGFSAGLEGALYAGIQGRSWLLVLAGMVFSTLNLLVALVCSLVVELRVRRAWVREQAATDAAGLAPGVVGPSQADANSTR